eukprot:m.60914 g.60914  ORF g.60914 m.60914 type:complete len:58 (+) comp16134_c0_seq1:103-276(+)
MNIVQWGLVGLAGVLVFKGHYLVGGVVGFCTVLWMLLINSMKIAAPTTTEAGTGSTG